MKVHGVRAGIIQALCQMGLHAHPQEFAALLREENGVIEEVDLLPGTIGGERHATMHLDMMPLDTHVAGSAHSHPSGVLHPSPADLAFFARAGRYHIIVGYPYHLENWCCFFTNGSVFELEVLE
jgi:proteasome lid subunit RPN8/RPN11